MGCKRSPWSYELDEVTAIIGRLLAKRLGEKSRLGESGPHEPDCGVVEVRNTGGPEVGQRTANRDNAGRLRQREAEALGPNEFINVAGQRVSFAGIEFFERLLNPGIDLATADLAKVTVPAGCVNRCRR